MEDKKTLDQKTKLTNPDADEKDNAERVKVKLKFFENLKDQLKQEDKEEQECSN